MLREYRWFKKEFWTKSWSRVWGWTKVAAGTFLLGWHEMIGYVGSIVNDPDVKDALHSMALPAYVGLGLAVLGVITLVARRHRDV